MLKGIPNILSPELLKVLCEMGHSDQIVLADGNFPSEKMGKECKVIRCDGHSVPDKVETPIWNVYSKIIKKYDNRGNDVIQNIERYDFYEQAKKSYAIVATGEKALYANIILQKGVVVD